MEFLSPSSAGPFTLQLFSSHRSASRGDSGGQRSRFKGQFGSKRKEEMKQSFRKESEEEEEQREVMATSNGVASRGQHASHVLSITGVVGTAPCLEVHGVTPRNETVTPGYPRLLRGHATSGRKLASPNMAN